MKTSLARLLRLELSLRLRQPMTWLVLILLFAAMLVGASNGTSRVARERATLAAAKVEQDHAVRTARTAAEHYARPSNLTIEYHRDPTDAFGYMNYFLVTHAVKPPLPLGALAVGQSDMRPYQIRIDFSAIFPDAAYDLGNPYELKLGAFDLAFVLVYLVPLGLIALGATCLVGEQDAGILRLIAAQPVSPRRVAAAKYLALCLISAGAIPASALVALLATGGLIFNQALPLVGLMLALWAAFWIALCALVASFWRGAIGSITALVLAWTGITVLVPAGASLVIDLVHPAPSRIAYIDSSRQAMDDFYADETSVHAAWLARFPRFAAVPQTVSKPEVKRFARDDYYRRALMPLRQDFEGRQQAVLGTGGKLKPLSPALMLDAALQTLAGTDPQRHAAFVRAADAYSERLRRYFEPLALANAAWPQPACAGCPGRLNFTRYDEVPRFSPVVDEWPGLIQSIWTCLYFGLLATIIGLAALRRYREWPV